MTIKGWCTATPWTCLEIASESLRLFELLQTPAGVQKYASFARSIRGGGATSFGPFLQVAVSRCASAVLPHAFYKIWDNGLHSCQSAGYPSFKMLCDYIFARDTHMTSR